MVPPPAWLTLVSVGTVFCVLFGLGLGTDPRELRWELNRRGTIARGLVAVLVVVPVAAWFVVLALDVPRAQAAGIMLMAIAPGAPVALRRSLGAGGHRSFAPALQILVAALAAISMPWSIDVLNAVAAGHAELPAGSVVRQVATAQLLPIGLGMALRHWRPASADRLAPTVTRIGALLLVAMAIAWLVATGHNIIESGPRVVSAVILITAIALIAGHALGAPAPETRTAVAICSAARNPGLALMVASINHAPPLVTQTILAYLFVSAAAITPYAIWRSRAASRTHRST